MDCIKELKASLIEQTEQITFKGKEGLIYQETERLLVKGFETLWRSTGALSTLLQRQLDERTKYFENQVQQQNLDSNNKEKELKEKLSATEQQLNEQIVKSKVMEQRVQALKEQKDDLQLKLKDQTASIQSEKEKVDESLKAQNQQLLDRVRQL